MKPGIAYKKTVIVSSVSIKTSRTDIKSGVSLPLGSLPSHLHSFVRSMSPRTQHVRPVGGPVVVFFTHMLDQEFEFIKPNQLQSELLNFVTVYLCCVNSNEDIFLDVPILDMCAERDRAAVIEMIRELAETNSVTLRIMNSEIAATLALEGAGIVGEIKEQEVRSTVLMEEKCQKS